VHDHVAAASLAIADLRVFGNADGALPPVPGAVNATRSSDERNATVRWRPVPGAVGYNVRWGIRPDRLTHTYQRFANQGTSLELRSLNVGQHYFIAVEAFNETGVSQLSSVVRLASH
jgi:xylan 1,4-beta-xylosidase